MTSKPIRVPTAPPPETTSSTPKPKPTTSTPEPEPTTSTPEPKPTTSNPEPKPTTSTSEPKPTTSSPKPKASPVPQVVNGPTEYTGKYVRSLSLSIRKYSRLPRGTFFYQGGVAGACGTVHSDDDLIAAIGECSLWPVFAPPKLDTLQDQRRYGNPGAKSELCGKTVVITNGDDKTKSVTVRIEDDCPSCETKDSIDLSVAAFQALAPLSQGVAPIAWSFV